MGQLENLGPQVRSRGKQGYLRSGLDVAGEQHAASRSVDPHHQGGFVARESTGAWRPEWCDLKIREPLGSISPALLADLDLALLGFGEERCECRISRAARRKPEPICGNALEHRAQSSAVVEVRVTRDHKVEAPYPQSREGWHHGDSPQIRAPGKRRPTVEEDGGPAPLDNDRTPLSHIEQRGAFAGVF